MIQSNAAAEVKLPGATAAQEQLPDAIEPMDYTENCAAERDSPVESKRKTH